MCTARKEYDTILCPLVIECYIFRINNSVAESLNHAILCPYDFGDIILYFIDLNIFKFTMTFNK